jgi:hypothetical protein
MMIRREKLRKLVETLATVPFRPSGMLYEHDVARRKESGNVA